MRRFNIFDFGYQKRGFPKCIIQAMKTILSFILTNHYEGVVSTIVAVLYIVLSLATAVHILITKYDIKSASGWIALVFLSPFVGTILYIFLGINRVSRKAARLGRVGNVGSKFSQAEKEAIIQNMPFYSKNIIVYGQNLYPQEFLKGNKIKPLKNGIEAYPEMIEAIRNAKKEVLVEVYIFDSDSVTEKFLDAFKTAINAGAEVKVLVDGIGALKFFKRDIEKKLSKIKGLQYGIFLPPRVPISVPFVNLRNHRKIMVIDGKIAFFGGMNLSQDNVLTDDKENAVCDITFRVEGAVIDQICQVFEEDWFFVKGENFESCSNFIDYEIAENGEPARVIPDGPDIKERRIQLLIGGALHFALDHIVVATPYLLPENDIVIALEMAAMRGINVEIIVPQMSDHKFITWAQEANLEYLIERGVKIYKQPPPFDHSKIFVVDGAWSFIGSANWDVRSFRLNFEANMEIYSKELAAELLGIVEEKKAVSRLVTLEECRDIGFARKIRNKALRLLTPYY